MRTISGHLLWLILCLFSPAHAAEHAAIILQSGSVENDVYLVVKEPGVSLIGELTVVHGVSDNKPSKPVHSIVIFLGSELDLKTSMTTLKAEDLVIMLGPITQASGLKLLKKAPMAALVLSPSQLPPLAPGLSFDISSRTLSDDPDEAFYNSIKQISIFPISFDDNPMEYLPAEGTNNLLGLIGEFQR